MDPVALRSRLEAARLMLIFTPSVCAREDEALRALDAALPHVDVVQVRIKAGGASAPTSAARDLHDWTERVLVCVAAAPRDPLVLVDDRVDVAAALAGLGVHGVHLGQDDCPPSAARELLGPVPLIGLSTHSARQVAAAEAEPVDYLGFGPIHASATKGVDDSLGADAAWIASEASPRPVFPIGGIDASNAAELSRVGRAAVCAAVLRADDPAEAARSLSLLLSAEAAG